MEGKMDEIEIAMGSICDYYSRMGAGHEIDKSYLCRDGIRTEKEADNLIGQLCAMHLITYDSEYIRGGETIKLTDKGKLFLAEKRNAREADKVEDEKEAIKEKRQFAHDWKIATFSALAGAFLSMPLWKVISWIASLF